MKTENTRLDCKSVNRMLVEEIVILVVLIMLWLVLMAMV
jgi:hypothetical protein